MPLETARKYQEAKALAEFQCDSDKHEDIGGKIEICFSNLNLFL